MRANLCQQSLADGAVSPGQRRVPRVITVRRLARHARRLARTPFMATATRRLTNQRIATAVKLGKKAWLSDDISLRGWGRLIARISNPAAALFYFRYSVAGRLKFIPLGPHSEHEQPGCLTLEQAREETNRLSALYRNPVSRDVHAALKSTQAARPNAFERSSPSSNLRAPETSGKSAASVSLLALVELYQAQLKEDGKVSWRDVAGMIRRELAPLELARKPAVEITPDDIVGILRDVVKRSPRTASQLQASIHAAFGAAMNNRLDSQRLAGWGDFQLTTNPVKGVGQIKFNDTKERNLNGRDLGLLWLHLNEVPARDSIAYRFLRVNLLLAGQRCRQLMRVKLSDVDEYERTITLMDGKGRRATPRQHILPISDLVWQEISELKSVANAQDCEFLFAGRRRGGACYPQTISHVTTDISKELAATEFDGQPVKRFTYADLRRTTESRMGQLEISKEMKGQLLSHGLSGVQETRYDRYSYVEPKQKALAVWEAYVLKMAEEQRATYVQTMQKR